MITISALPYVHSLIMVLSVKLKLQVMEVGIT